MSFVKSMLGASLCVCIAFACCIAATIYLSPSAKYKRQKDEVSLRYLLATEVKPGHSRQQVCDLLGEGRPDDGSQLRKLLKYQAAVHFDKRLFPDGIEETDEIIFYTALPAGAYDLQFRDGRLVNFNPGVFLGKNMSLNALQP